MHRTIIFLALALITAASAPLAAEPIVRTLANGMTVIVEEMRGAPVAAVRFYVGAGSVHEQEFTGAGISHFVEHVVGRASAKYSAEEIREIKETMGKQANAYTSSDHTCYHMVSSARFVDDMVDLIADYVFFPLLEEETVETERGVILREMAMGDDDPRRRIIHLLDQTMFRMHPERYRIIGYPERFNRLTREDLVAYHRRMYTTDNALAVVVGDVDAAEVLETLERSVGRIPRAGTPLPALPAEPAQVSERRAEEIAPQLARAHLALGYRTVDLFHPDLYPLDVMAYVLARGTGSRLVARLRDELGLVDSISCYSYTPTYDAGRFVVLATLDEANLAEAERAIREKIERLTAEPVTAEELARAQNQKAAESVYARGGAASRADLLGRDFLATGDADFSRRYVAGIRAVTAQDMQAAARRYFRPENLTVAVRRPGEVEIVARPEDTRPAAPQTTRRVLPNGIVLLTQQDRRAPLVAVQASFLGGLRFETDEIAGMGGVMASMLQRGTASRSRLDIARALEDVGASLGATSGRNSLTIGGRALAEHADLLVKIMSDCIRNPAFPEEELERVRSLQLAAIRAREERPSEVASRLMLEALFTTHPYRIDPLGTEVAVAGSTREALAAHHARICRPGGMVLSLYGDIEPGQAEALARRHFGDWSGTPAPPPALAPQEPPAGEVRSATERAQEQAMFFMGFIGPRVDGPDRFALDVLDAALSGIRYPAGRLHTTLRGQQLVYATHMVPVGGLEPGFIMLYAATAPDKLEVVEEIIRGLITDLQTTPLPDEELHRARSMCIVAREVELGELSNRVMQENLDELYGLGFERALEYAERIERVTAAEVQEAARKYLDLDRCVIVITAPLTKGGDEGEEDG